MSLLRETVVYGHSSNRRYRCKITVHFAHCVSLWDLYDYHKKLILIPWTAFVLET
jgi:hypothetical protein